MKRLPRPWMWAAWAVSAALFMLVLAAALPRSPLFWAVGGASALLLGGLAAFAGALADRWQLPGDERRALKRAQAKLHRARAQMGRLREEMRRLNRDVERARRAAQQAQKEASAARRRAEKAEQQARRWQQEAQAQRQRADDLAARLQKAEAELARARKARTVLEAVHRLEQWQEEVLAPDERPEDLDPATLFQRLREALERREQERQTAWDLAQETEAQRERLQQQVNHLQHDIAQLQDELAAKQSEVQALRDENRDLAQHLQHILEDLTDPQTDIIAVPEAQWRQIAPYRDRRRGWEALLARLRHREQRQQQTKALPQGEGFVYPRGRQPKRVLYFEQPIQKRIVWVCRLWDAHEDDRDYEEFTTKGAPRSACPESAAFVYWTPPRSSSSS